MPKQTSTPARSAVRSPPALAAKANDLDALRATVVDAAGVSGALWLSYLFVLFYFLVAAGGVTHEDFFFERTVRLPFLNVDLPLKGFFWLGPIIFVIVHAYILLHFVVLAGKVRVLDRALIEQIPRDETRAALRRQLPANIFVQYLAGPREIRGGLVGLLLRIVALISLVIGPISLLLFFELQFLPYHAAGITWVQRVAVATDLLLIWWLWPLIGLPRRRTDGHGWHVPEVLTPLWQLTLFGLCLIVAVGFPLVTTFPGEWLDSVTLRVLYPLAGGEEPMRLLLWARVTLVEGEVDETLRRPASPFSNRLVLPGLDAINHAKLESDAKMDASPVTVSLRGRQLRRAVLSGATLRKADFTGVDLRGALLDGADLRGANFGCGDRDAAAEGDRKTCANLDGASLNRASLQGAFLSGALLKGARLAGISLQGAVLDRASLQGAFLEAASLQGASLMRAELQGASLNNASLQGAYLGKASLEGASLVEADFRGAMMERASLMAADATEALFMGASLREASLQGSKMWRASLVAASVAGSYVWRASIDDWSFDHAYVENVILSPKARCDDASANYSCAWTMATFRRFHDDMASKVPPGELRTAMLARFDEWLDPGAKPDSDVGDSDWRSLMERPHGAFETEDEQVKVLAEAGCRATDAPYVARAMISRMLKDPWPLFKYDHTHRSGLAAALLREDCKGARGLADGEISQLREWTERPSTP